MTRFNFASSSTPARLSTKMAKVAFKTGKGKPVNFESKGEKSKGTKKPKATTEAGVKKPRTTKSEKEFEELKAGILKSVQRVLNKPRKT